MCPIAQTTLFRGLPRLIIDHPHLPSFESAQLARTVCPASVKKPEYLAEIERFRLMDDDFMSKCLENAPECIELILQIILGKKDLKVIKSQTEYPIKSLQGRGVRVDKTCTRICG